VTCVGLLGGTFDPPHRGHVLLAEAAKRHFTIDPLRVLVSANPPHKVVTTPIAVRLELARIAFPDDEVIRDDNPYSIDTVSGFGDDAVFLVGADQFARFLTWRSPDEILRHVRLGVATRPGYRREELESVLAQLERPKRVEFFDLEPVPISSSEVRERASRGESIDELLPRAVADEIGRLGLYGRPLGVS
jgi:nicotinate-nucleotide adenylyltransferase